MSAPGTPKIRSGNLLLVGILLTISILLEQFLIAPLVPLLGQLGGVRPMIVFLDIPLPLPNIDWIPVSLLFAFFYGLVISPDLANRGQTPGALRRKKLWDAITGWWLLLLFILAGGGLYFLVQDLLPRQVRNGIDSFGVRADITLPYPSGGLVHLHGSMLLLLCSVIGFRLLLKKTALPPAVVPGPATSPIISKPRPAAAASPAPPPVVQGKRYQPATVEPGHRQVPVSVHDQYLAPDPTPDCRLTTPPPVAVIMPRPTPRIGSAHPCVVPDTLKPAKS